MKKILILGSKGMVGHMLKVYLEELPNYEVVGLTRQELDIKNFSQISNFDFSKFDYVVNCIAILIRRCNESPSDAFLINGWFPHYLSERTSKDNFKLIQVSTDCIFQGNSLQGYYETSIPDADYNYGKSKAAGEPLNCANTLTLRASLIGPELKEKGEGLFHWFLTCEKNKIKGYNKAFWNGITTLEFAKVVDLCLKDFFNGVYHSVPDVFTNKYLLLRTINEIFSLGKSVVKDPTIQYNKVLRNTRKDFFNPQIPHDYSKMLTELREWIKNKGIYNYNCV